MSDQYDSGNSDRSGATPWNSPDPTRSPDTSATYDSGTGYGSGQHDATTPAPSYSQASYPQSAYGAQGQTPQYGTYGATDPNAYGAGPKPQGLAITALVLGIIALLTSWFPLLGLVGVLLAVIAIVVGIMALSRVKKGTGGGKGLAIGGIVTGAIALVIGLLINGLMIAGLAAMSDSGVGFDRIMECTQLPTQQEQQACLDQYTQQLEQQPADRT